MTLKVRPGTIPPGEPTFVGEVEPKPDWGWYEADNIRVHIVRHGRPYCARKIDWEAHEAERWFGFDRERVLILSCPARLQCGECYHLWCREHFPESCGKLNKKERKQLEAKTKGATGMDVTRPAPGKPRARTREPVAPVDMLAEIDRETGIEPPAYSGCKAEPGTCRVCGCTDQDCSQCVVKTGRACYWVETNLCSACEPELVLGTPRGVQPIDADFEALADKLFAEDAIAQTMVSRRVAEGRVASLERVLGLPPAIAAAERILGIDPGFRTIAVFVLELTATSVRCIYKATLHTTPNTVGGSPARDKQRRLDSIIGWLYDVFRDWHPSGVAYEGVAGVATGKDMRGSGNADRANLIKVCGAIRALAYLTGPIACEEIAVSSARVAALGRGNSRGATKKQVRTAVERLTGCSKLTLDQADAGALALAFHGRRVEASAKEARARKKLSRRQAAYKPRSKDGHEVPGAQATGKGNASRNAPAKRARKRNPPRHPAGEATLARSLIRRGTDV